MPSPQPPEDPALDRLLDRWRQATPAQPHPVEPEVWRRLAQPQAPAIGARWLDQIHAAFARPSFAAIFVAACVLLGLFLAEVRQSRLRAEYGAHLAQNYARLIDPLLSASSASPRSAASP